MLVCWKWFTAVWCTRMLVPGRALSYFATFCLSLSSLSKKTNECYTLFSTKSTFVKNVCIVRKIPVIYVLWLLRTFISQLEERNSNSAILLLLKYGHYNSKTASVNPIFHTLVKRIGTCLVGGRWTLFPLSKAKGNLHFVDVNVPESFLWTTFFEKYLFQ